MRLLPLLLLLGCAPPRGAPSPRAAVRQWSGFVRAGRYADAARLLTPETRDAWVIHRLMATAVLTDAMREASERPYVDIVRDGRALLQLARERHRFKTAGLEMFGFVPVDQRGPEIEKRFEAVPDRDRFFGDVFGFSVEHGWMEHLVIGEPDLLFVADDSATVYLHGTPHGLSRIEGAWFLSLPVDVYSSSEVTHENDTRADPAATGG